MLGIFLAGCSGDAGSQAASNGTANTAANSPSYAAIPATTVPGNFHEFPLPQANSGMMRPAIDHKGRVWFGEMDQNHLAVFDPRTQKIQQMVPPHGRFGLMGIEVAADDTIWFAEQYANYIGHYIPATGAYHLYALPMVTTPDPSNPNNTLTLPSAPNDLAFDTSGNLWFTEINADALGKLNTTSGIIQQYPLSRQKSVQKLDPYGISVDAHGIVWFTEAATNQLGRLDPTTGNIRYYSVPHFDKTLMEVTSDSRGIIWITTFSADMLLSFNPAAGAFTAYPASFTGNHSGGVYGVVAVSPTEIWVTISEENIIARLNVSAKRFYYYAIPTASSLPLGLVVNSQHTIYFTEAGADKIGMLQP